MAAPRKNSLFPSDPYYIPGYEGFIPQFNFQFGETFGKTTYRLLTDPTVTKSPRSLLAPLHTQNVVEDFSRTNHDGQGYLPTHPGYLPYEKPGAAPSFPEPLLGPKPPPPELRPAEAKLTTTHADTVPQCRFNDYIRRIQVPHIEYPQRTSRHPATEEHEWQLPKLTPAYGLEKRREPSDAFAGSKSLVNIEDVTVPGADEITDVEREDWLPKLDIPNVIQQKVIPGYAGFIPCFTCISGVNYIRNVKEAMKEFDRQQLLQRNPACKFGKRFPQTYWPDTRIYTSAGLIPSYMGFVPDLRHTYALTFGNGTRKAYQKQQRRRGCAL